MIYNNVKNSNIICSGDKIEIVGSSERKTFELGVYGDLNGDKVIDSFDLVQMRRDIQNEQASTSSDLNRDEFVDEDDLIELQEY